MDSLYFLIKSLSSGESPNLSNMNSDFTSATIIRNTETTNMDDGVSMLRQFCQFYKLEFIKISFAFSGGFSLMILATVSYPNFGV